MTGLFTPLTIKGHTLNNRIVLPPMANNMATERGEITDAHIEHYVRRARAGVGMVVIEHTYVRHDGRLNAQQMGIYDDSLIPGLRRLADAVRACGAVVGIQITHGGGKAPAAAVGRQPISASDGLVPGASDGAQAATQSESRRLWRHLPPPLCGPRQPISTLLRFTARTGTCSANFCRR